MVAALLVVATLAYGLASYEFLNWNLRYDARLRRRGVAATLVATLLLGAGVALDLLGQAGSGAGHLAFGPRVMLIVTCGVTGLFVAGRTWRALPVAGSVVAPIAAVVVCALGIQALEPAEPPVVAALGPVSVLHISATILGFLLFVPAYVLSVLFLSQQYALKTRNPVHPSLPSLMRLDHLAWRLLYVGFPLYSSGLLLGLAWHERVPGAMAVPSRHVFAVLGWLFYAGIIWLHVRRGWRGRGAALAVMGAFVVTLGAVLLYVTR